MGGLKVAIVGAGRMGALLAGSIPANCRKVIISRRKGRAVSLADEVGGLAADQLSAVRGAQVIFLAVPGTAAIQVVQDMLPHVDPGTLVVNLATDLATAELAAAYPAVTFAAAKVIGHAREMGLGTPGVVVIDHVDGEAENHLRYLLEGLGPIVREREEKVSTVHAAITDAMARAEAELVAKLSELGFSADMARAAIAATGPGVLHGLTNGDGGLLPQLPRTALQAQASVSH